MDLAEIEDVPTRGASAETAAQDNLPYSGVRASEKLAETDLDRMKQYYRMIERVGHRYRIDPYLIAGIISRESRAGKTLEDGWGDWDYSRRAWNAFGLMQVDVNPKGGAHKPRGAWDSEEHLNHATEILVHFIGLIKQKFGHWEPKYQLKGGIAAYNQGDGNVHEGYDIDAFTTGKDYANDVVARAQWFKKKRVFILPTPPEPSSPPRPWWLVLISTPRPSTPRPSTPPPSPPQLRQHDDRCPICGQVHPAGICTIM